MLRIRTLLSLAVLLIVSALALGSFSQSVSAQGGWSYQSGDTQNLSSGTTQFSAQIFVGPTSSVVPCNSEDDGWIAAVSDTGLTMQIGQFQSSNASACDSNQVTIFAQQPTGVQGYCYQSQTWSFNCETSLASLNLLAGNWYTFYIVPSNNYDYLGVADGGGTVHWVMTIPDSGVTSLLQAQERNEFISMDGSVNPYGTSSYSVDQYFQASQAYNGTFYYPTLFPFNGFTGGSYTGTLCNANPPFGEQFYGNREDYTGTGYACS